MGQAFLWLVRLTLSLCQSHQYLSLGGTFRYSTAVPEIVVFGIKDAVISFSAFKGLIEYEL